MFLNTINLQSQSAISYFIVFYIILQNYIVDLYFLSPFHVEPLSLVVDSKLLT